MLKFFQKKKNKKKTNMLQLAMFWLGWLAAGLFIILLARLTTIRFAVLVGAILILLVLVGVEVVSRRTWEKKLLSKLEDQDKEYTRLVREIARNRNELSQIKKGLGDAGRAASQAAEGRLRNTVEERMLSNIAQQLTNIGTMARPDAGHEAVGELSAPEKPVTTPPYDEPKSMDMSDGQPPLTALPGPGDDQILKLLREAVDDDRIDIFLQPIVSLPQRKLRYYEMFSRIRMKNKEYIPARRYINLALKANLLPAIDNLLLLRALQLIRDVDLAGGERGYFCNISPLTLSDSKFMGDLVEFISQNRHLASRLIFELSHDDMIDPTILTPELEEVLNGLARLGCRFSIEGARPETLDMEFVRAQHVRYLKLEAGYMLDKLDERAGFSRLKRLKSELDRRGIDLIVTHIEQERHLIELLDLEIDYGQGYLFGEPEKADVL